MPVDKAEFEGGSLPIKVEDEIVSFLRERKEGAFTSQEIMAGMDFHTDFSTPEIAMMSTFAITDFAAVLHDMAERGKIMMKVVRGRMYFMAGEVDVAKCPKCGVEVAAKKTWKMAGRPDKKGRRLQLHMGIFECSKHGFFRAVLSKRKI